MIDLGISREQLHEQYDGKRVYLRRGALDAHFFPRRALQELLYCCDAREPFVQLHFGSPIPDSLYTEEIVERGVPRRRLRPSELQELLRRGAALVLGRAEIKSLPLRQLCLAVGRFLGEPTAASGHLACGGQGVFDAHWEPRGAFVFQLLGRKRWRVFAPGAPLPLGARGAAERGGSDSREPLWEGVLEAGDALYVPRGAWQHGAPVAGETAFHVALSAHRPLLPDHLLWTCAEPGPESAQRRQALRLDREPLDVVPGAAEVLRRELFSAENLGALRERVLERGRAHAGLGLRLLPGDAAPPAAGAVALSPRHAGRRAAAPLGESAERLLAVLLRLQVCTLEELRGQLGEMAAAELSAAIRELAQQQLVDVCERA